MPIKMIKARKRLSLVRSVLPRLGQRRAQEEMVGFAVIVIIVAVILLVMLGIWLNKPKETGVESYKAESFIQAILEQTTSCTRDFGGSYSNVIDLIEECDSKQVCTGESSETKGTPACEILNSTISDILESSWPAGPNRPVKGYVLNVTSGSNEIASAKAGNETSNYQSGIQDFSKRGASYRVELKVYY